MAKSILYRLFGFGKIPKQYRSAIEKEGVIFQDEGLAIVLRYTNFRAPNTYYGRRISLTVGSVVLTKHRFACYRGRFIPPVFEVPVEHEAFKAFGFSLDEKARFRVVIDAPALEFSKIYAAIREKSGTNNGSASMDFREKCFYSSYTLSARG